MHRQTSLGKRLFISSKRPLHPTFQGAPRPTPPLALERRRLLQELDTARRMTDQTTVEQTRTEVTLIEKKMRRFLWQLLRRRRAN